MSPVTRVGALEVYVPPEADPAVRWAGLRPSSGRALGVSGRREAALAASDCGPILVVDDDPLVLSVIAEVLDMMGFAVETATNGQEALDALAHLQPSLLMLDMHMPVLDGPQLVEAMQERGINPPIMVMTGTESAKQWALEIGAIGYLPKPLDVVDLLAAVEAVRVA